MKSQCEEYLSGFAEFSAYIGSDRDLALFRRFDVLGARNLLYLQGELLCLEAQLAQFDREDKATAEDQSIDDDEAMQVLQAARDWESFCRHAQKDERQAKRMKLVLQIRSAMKEYQEALVLHSNVLQLPSPQSRVLKVFSTWFDAKVPLISHGQRLLEHSEDFSALRPSLDQDRLSKAMQNRLGFLFKEKRHVPESWGDTCYVPEKTVARFVSIVTVLLSVAALMGAIICLSYVRAAGLRLGLLGVFTATFAVTVGLLTDARRAELFGSTAAYAAVLVVFLGTNTNFSVS